MCSTWQDRFAGPGTLGAIRAAGAAVTALPPAHAGLGTQVDDEVAALADLIETASVALLERAAVLDTSGAHRSSGHGSVEAWLAQHTLVHDRGWTIHHQPDGTITLHPPQQE